MKKDQFEPTISRGTWREERAELIDRAELKLLHTVAFILGVIYMGMLLFKVDTTWYGWLLMTAFTCFCIVIVFRFVKDLINGVI